MVRGTHRRKSSTASVSDRLHAGGCTESSERVVLRSRERVPRILDEGEARVEGGGIEPVVPTRSKVLLRHLVVWREQIGGGKATVGVKLA